MEISKLQQLIERMTVLRDMIDTLDDEKKQLNKELATLKAECVEHLEAHGLRRFDGEKYMVIVAEKRSLKINDKYEFYEYLKDKDIFEDVVSVPVGKLAGIYEEEMERAKERGDFGFLKDGIPGLSEPSTFKTITFRKRG